MGFCFDLKYEVEDLEETWDFTKKENLESDDEEEEEATPGLKEVKELTHEDIEKVNNALKSHTFCVQELKRKVEHELYMAESAAIAGWGPVSVLENKIYDNVSGANAAEKELKTQKIRKATETYAKEQKLYMKGEPSNGFPFKLKKRPSYLHGNKFKKFSGGHQKSRNSGGYDGFAGMAATVGGHGGYGQSYGGGRGGGYGDGVSHRGRGGYRGAGGSRGGNRPTRACHRSAPWLR